MSLAQRMEAMEDLLKENIRLTKALASNDTPKHSPEESQVTLRQRGALIQSESGHVRYVCTRDAAAEFVQNYPSSDSPFSDLYATTRQNLLDLLPPLSHCDELKAVFMEVFSPLFHILHDPSFDQEYARFRQHPHDVKLTFLALLFVVLAIGVTALDENHPLLADIGKQSVPGANVRDISSKYRNAALRTLTADQYLWRHNLKTVQSLVLLIYALSHAHGPAWSLLGTTLNIAIAIGCHIDPAHLQVDIVEAEERRRCWAALLMLYTIQETVLGIQAPILIQSDAKSPADIEDEDIVDSMSDTHPTVQQPRPPSKMAYLLRKFDLYRLAANVCVIAACDTRDELKVVELDILIQKEQEKSQKCFVHFEDLPLYHQAHFYILDSYVNHLNLVLHSPVLTMTDPVENPSRSHSIEKLYNASSAILANYDILRTTSKFQKYRWYTDGLGSFYAFLAASTLLMMRSQDHIGAHKAEDLAASVYRCLAHLRTAQTRSDICERAAGILFRLLDPPRQRSVHSYDQDSATSSDRAEDRCDCDHGCTRNIPSGSVDPGLKVNLSAADSYNYAQNASHTFTNLQTGIDLNGWTISEEFQEFFCRIPSQQWLSPALFPWSDWNGVVGS